MIETRTGYRLIASNMPRTLDRISKNPTVCRETEYYRKKIGDVKTINDFMSDTRLYNYALKAFGLEDMAYAKAFIRKVLCEGVQNKTAMANKLSDKRYYELAQSFDFVSKGEAVTQSAEATQAVIDKFIRQTLEKEAGKQNEGVRLALYFDRKSQSLANAYDILGDKALIKIVQTAFGWPDTLSRSDIDKQAKAIEAKIDFSKLKDPKYVAKFLSRFVSMFDLKTTSNTPAAAAQMLGQVPSVGISSDILLTLQSLKTGG